MREEERNHPAELALEVPTRVHLGGEVHLEIRRQVDLAAVVVLRHAWVESDGAGREGQGAGALGAALHSGSATQRRSRCSPRPGDPRGARPAPRGRRRARRTQGRQAAIASALAHCLWATGQFEPALEPGERALELATRAGDLFGQLNARFVLAEIRYSLGDYESAIAHFLVNIEMESHDESWRGRRSGPGISSIVGADGSLCR